MAVSPGRGVSSAGSVERAPSVGAWRSLVARIVRDDKVGGSNPLAPTISVLASNAWMCRGERHGRHRRRPSRHLGRAHARLEVLAAIEDEKRTLAPGDPRLVELAQRVEDVARRVLSSTVRQRQLTEVGSEQVEAAEPGTPVTSIDETPRAIADILAAWRAAERRAAPRNPARPRRPKRGALADHHREEYRRALEERETDALSGSDQQASTFRGSPRASLMRLQRSPRLPSR